MASRDDSQEENHIENVEGLDEEDEGSNGSSSRSSSLPATDTKSSSSHSSSLPATEMSTTGQYARAHQGVEATAIYKGKNLREDDADQNQSSPLLFNPNEKGTKKQKRCDYDSDDRSYEGLGLEYKRRKLPTTRRKDAFLPGATKMVDFDDQGTKTWGLRLLFETMTESEIDSLVGLANSYDISCEDKRKSNVRSKFGHHGNVPRNVDEETAPSSPSLTNPMRSADEDIFHRPHRHNPLLSVTYESPLPPSHIDFLKSRIRHHVLQASKKDKDRNKKKNEKGNNNEPSCKDSAVAAMSMYLEECLTACLLPLAGLHALRCQTLEAMESEETTYGFQPTATHPITGEHVPLDVNKHIRWKEENSFQEWTLPPEEAILKLFEQGILSNDYPYQFVPRASRFWTPTDLVEGKHRNCNEVSSNLGSLDMAAWAKSYKINERVFSANREILDIFLPQKRATPER